MWNLTAFDARFVAAAPPILEDRGAYRSDREAWEAVLRDPTLAIVDPAFLQNGGGPANFAAEPGSHDHASRIRTPAGRACSPSPRPSPIDYFIENGVFYGLAGARTLFGYPLALDRLYVALRPGTDADQFAEDVQATFLANGTEAVAIPTIMDEGYTMTRQIFQLFQGYLAHGSDRRHRRHRGRDGPRSSRAAAPDRHAPRARLRLAAGRTELRDRDRASSRPRER